MTAAMTTAVHLGEGAAVRLGGGAAAVQAAQAVTQLDLQTLAQICQMQRCLRRRTRESRWRRQSLRQRLLQMPWAPLTQGLAV